MLLFILLIDVSSCDSTHGTTNVSQEEKYSHKFLSDTEGDIASYHEEKKITKQEEILIIFESSPKR